MNNIVNDYVSTMKKYVVFSGRASRKEYWTFVLINMLIGFIIGLAEGMMGLAGEGSTGPISAIFSLATLLPGLAVAIRRMHDVDKSGWFILIPIYNLILALTKGTEGENKYGAQPPVDAVVTKA